MPRVCSCGRTWSMDYHMSVKILASSIIGLEQFRQSPLNALHSAEQGAVAVFENNQPVIYAVTPARFAELIAAEAAVQRQADISLDEQFFAEPTAVPPAPVGKFPLYSCWQPGPDFLRQAALWGINLSQGISDEELTAFIAYWQAEGRVFHHIQWQQKFARYLQISRGAQAPTGRRDITQISAPDDQIPAGFRGE